MAAKMSKIFREDKLARQHVNPITLLPEPPHTKVDTAEQLSENLRWLERSFDKIDEKNKKIDEGIKDLEKYEKRLKIVGIGIIFLLFLSLLFELYLYVSQ